MSDYIDRQVALDALGVTKNATKYGGDHSGYDTRMLYEIHDALTGIPAADVVPVVRCKDCKHWNPQLKTANGNGLGSCDFHDVALVTSEGFCYWAEKRGEQE